MKQLPGFIPFIWPELPCLSSRHDANYTIPAIRTKFTECFDAIDDEISRFYRGLLAAGVDRRALSVDRYEVFGADISLCGGACASFLRGFKSA
jgi:hypothetical protein